MAVPGSNVEYNIVGAIEKNGMRLMGRMAQSISEKPMKANLLPETKAYDILFPCTEYKW